VFLLLGFQFRSLTLPALIFLSQPVSLTSALFALWLTGTPLVQAVQPSARFRRTCPAR
jgi:multidrug efflux pump subunit AcrB